MTLPRTVAEILRDHVTLEVEGIDRMYLNAVVPILQNEHGIRWFFRECRGFRFASSALMAPMTRAFVEALEEYARTEKVDVVTFERRQRKDNIAAEYRLRFRGEEGVLFVGKAQEKSSIFRTERRRNPSTGASYAWLVRSTAITIPLADRHMGTDPYTDTAGDVVPAKSLAQALREEHSKSLWRPSFRRAARQRFFI